MAPHHGVDVDKSAWKAGFYAQRLDNPRSRGAVHLVDENHVPTLRRDAPILDPHTASSWIELHLQPETANTDEVRLGPGPPVRQNRRRPPARLPAGIAGCEPSRGSAPEHGHIQSAGPVAFVVPDRGDDDRGGYADGARGHGPAGLRTSRCTATEYGCNSEEGPHDSSHNR